MRREALQLIWQLAEQGLWAGQQPGGRLTVDPGKTSGDVARYVVF